MRIGLVLGAGGVLGGAWLVGGLHAPATETGWDPGGAEYLVGTSAGAMVAVLSGSGMPPWFMLAHSAGETAEVDGPDEFAPGEASRSAGAVFRIHPGVPALGPLSSPANARQVIMNSRAEASKSCGSRQPSRSPANREKAAP